MIIVISSEGASLESEIDLRFGRCQYFCIYNTETKDIEFKENTGLNSNHGAGIAAGQLAVDFKAEVIITGNLGPKALAVIEGAGIKGYSSPQTTVEKCINLFNEDKLTLISEAGKTHK